MRLAVPLQPASRAAGVPPPADRLVSMHVAHKFVARLGLARPRLVGYLQHPDVQAACGLADAEFACDVRTPVHELVHPGRLRGGGAGGVGAAEPPRGARPSLRRVHPAALPALQLLPCKARHTICSLVKYMFVTLSDSLPGAACWGGASSACTRRWRRARSSPMRARGIRLAATAPTAQRPRYSCFQASAHTFAGASSKMERPRHRNKSDRAMGMPLPATVGCACSAATLARD